jgi:hypothetical protein
MYKNKQYSCLISPIFEDLTHRNKSKFETTAKNYHENIHMLRHDETQ